MFLAIGSCCFFSRPDFFFFLLFSHMLMEAPPFPSLLGVSFYIARFSSRPMKLGFFFVRLRILPPSSVALFFDFFGPYSIFRHVQEFGGGVAVTFDNNSRASPGPFFFAIFFAVFVPKNIGVVPPRRLCYPLEPLRQLRSLRFSEFRFTLEVTELRVHRFSLERRDRVTFYGFSASAFLLTSDPRLYGWL